MEKLYIAKNKNGKYYTVIKNDYLKCKKLVSVSLPKNMELTNDFGTYDCEYFLSCYPNTNGGAEVLIKVTQIHEPFKPVENPYDVYNNSTTPEIPF